MKTRIVKTYVGGSTKPGTLKIWRENWEQNGWTTRILTHWDARRNRRYVDGVQSEAMPWLALAADGGGFWVDDSVLVRNDFDMPEISGGGVVVLCGEGIRAALWASMLGSLKLAASALDKRTMICERRAELCVEAGSMDWDCAPLVHFSDNACKAHKRRKYEWMAEFLQINMHEMRH